MHFLACYNSHPLYQQLRNLEPLFIMVMVGRKADEKYTFKVQPIHTVDVMVV